MSSAFSVTAATNSITIEKRMRQQSVAYTVSNTSGQEVRGRASLATVPEKAPHLAWLAFPPNTEAERPFAIGATEQYSVTISVPPDAAPGNYTIRLNMVATHNPDETFSAGPTVTITVPEVRAEPKKFPIWIIPVILLVLVGIAAGIFFATRSKDVAVPDVVGLNEDAAGTEIAGVGLGIGRIRDENSSQEVGQVARTNPSAGTPVPKGNNVDLFISKGTAVPTPTTTPTVTPTATPNLAATAAVRATQTAVAANANATATSVAATATADAQLLAAIGKYTGTWVATDDSQGGLTKLEISNSGTTVTLRLSGKFYSINSNGFLAGLACAISIFNPDPNCEWGAGQFTYVGDPLSLKLPAHGLDHALTITITPDGQTLSVVDQVQLNGVTQFTQAYVLEPDFPIFTFATRVFIAPRDAIPFLPVIPFPTP